MDKAALRKDFLSKRLQLTDDEMEIKNELICQKLLQSFTADAPETIHIFLPQIGKKEIDTWKIINQLRIAFPKMRVIVPYVIPKTREMEHYELNAQTQLISNQWGIPEPDPATSILVDIQEIDFICIPLLAFDERGYRVGYGGGYYDRFLAKCRPDAVKTGLSYFEPLMKIEDTNSFDIRMDSCITPEKTWIW